MRKTRKVTKKVNGEWKTIVEQDNGEFDAALRELSLSEMKAWRNLALLGRKHPSFSTKYPSLQMADVCRLVDRVGKMPSKQPTKIEPYNMKINYKMLATLIVKASGIDTFTEKAETAEIKQSDRVAIVAASMFKTGANALPIIPVGDSLTKLFTANNKVSAVIGNQASGETMPELMADFKELAQSPAGDEVKKACIESAPQKLPLANDGLRFRQTSFVPLKFTRQVNDETKIQMASKFRQAIGSEKHGTGYFAQSHVDGATHIVGPQRKLQDRVVDFNPPEGVTAIWTDTKDTALLYGMRNKLRERGLSMPIFYDSTYANTQKIKKAMSEVDVPLLGCPLVSVMKVMPGAKVHAAIFKTPEVKKGKGVEGVREVKNADDSIAEKYEHLHSFQFYVSIHGWRSDVPMRLSALVRKGYMLRVSKNCEKQEGAIDLALNAVYHALIYVWVREPLLCVEGYKNNIEALGKQFNFTPDDGEEELISDPALDVDSALLELEKEDDIIKAMTVMVETRMEGKTVDEKKEAVKNWNEKLRKKKKERMGCLKKDEEEEKEEESDDEKESEGTDDALAQLLDSEEG